MITRHHISLASGSMLILYFPLVSVHPSVLLAIVAGVSFGVILPDIQMKRPKGLKALTIAWFLVQVFKKTVLRLYLLIFRRLFEVQPEAEDKRLTHSLPGLLFLTGFTGLGSIILAIGGGNFPGLYYMRVFLAGIIIGLLFHFIEDICTKKGSYLFYPFNSTYRIAGTIRPCNNDDSRIRSFHMQIIAIIAAMVLLYHVGLCPDALKWPVSIIAIVICLVLMVHSSDVRITGHEKVIQSANGLLSCNSR